MFKAFVSKSHPEFSSNRQQDAQEFFLHLVNLVEVSLENPAGWSEVHQLLWWRLHQMAFSLHQSLTGPLAGCLCRVHLKWLPLTLGSRCCWLCVAFMLCLLWVWWSLDRAPWEPLQVLDIQPPLKWSHFRCSSWKPWRIHLKTKQQPFPLDYESILYGKGRKLRGKSELPQ